MTYSEQVEKALCDAIGGLDDIGFEGLRQTVNSKVCGEIAPRLVEWIDAEAGGEFHRRQTMQAGSPRPPRFDDWTDGQIADALRFALVFHRMTFSAAMEGFADALLEAVGAQAFVRLKIEGLKNR